MSMRRGAMVIFIICICLGFSTSLPVRWQSGLAGLLTLSLALTMIYCIGRRWRSFSRRITIHKMAYLLMHVGFILLVMAGLVGMQGREFTLQMTEGQVVDLASYGNSLSVRADEIKAEYYPDGLPRQYFTALTFIENGILTSQKIASVNHPVAYRGLYFYQSAYSNGYEKISLLKVKTKPERPFLWAGSTFLSAGTLLWLFRRERTV